MRRSITEVKKDLTELSATSFVTKWILEHTPYIFDDNSLDYIRWRETLSTRRAIDPADIVITGSACLGFSLNPEKRYKALQLTMYHGLKKPTMPTNCK